MTDDPTRTYSINQAAEALGVSRRTIYNYLHDGRLESKRTAGGSQRILGPSLLALQARLHLSPPAAHV